MDQTNDLALWPILRRVPNDFLHITDRFFIFNNGESLLLFCRNGKVYGYGRNPYGMLGVPTDDIRQKYFGLLRFYCYNHTSLSSSSCPLVNEPKELIKLRFINIIALSKGDKHMMALTDLGDLYGWGCNHSGQLGLGWYRMNSIEPTLILHDVQKVCCGPKHTVALVMDGSIRIWGKFPGCPHNFTPERLIRSPSAMIDLITTKYLTIAYDNCFDNNDKGAFYVWGDLKQFGLSGSSSTVRLTYKRNDYSKIFKIIPIGMNKIMVLTRDGRVSILSIQNERVRSIRNPFRSINSIDFCIDIPEDPNVAIIRTSDDCGGQCFVWDDNIRRSNGQNLFSTNNCSIADTTCLYSSSFTPQLTRLPSKLLSSVLTTKTTISTFEFNDPRESDLIFRFKHYQSKPIYVHKAILMKYSNYFHWKLSTMANNGQILTIMIDDQTSYISMFIYLRYIYTKKISFNEIDDWILSEMYHLACKYSDQEFVGFIIFFKKNLYVRISSNLLAASASLVVVIGRFRRCNRHSAC
ncbi:RCC1 and BTB domain-containing protein 1 [Dermatophagoides pteronyssinus]|uniref:RCC1 and BTB domain-containing protein 1 n=1 Tax=Dermatophagoides pteronyssinus TaxID=6956 RepID=A0ABQ8JR25_DERPT|nr:RCC1 and BTB domain-containing protein 1 [Dermatophagoides pteronyssinus]